MSPFHLYCKNCGWRIVVGRDKEITWAAYAVVGVITLVLAQFIIARAMSRLAVLVVLWLLSFALVEIIISFVIVNFAHFSKPEVSAEDDDIAAD